MKEYKTRFMTQAEFDGYEDYPVSENTILFVLSEKALCMDITATGKRIFPILRKMESSLKAAGYEDHAAWFTGWIEQYEDTGEIDWNYSGAEDRKRGCWSYSWGFEQYDGCWYIFLNLAREITEYE